MKDELILQRIKEGRNNMATIFEGDWKFYAPIFSKPTRIVTAFQEIEMFTRGFYRLTDNESRIFIPDMVLFNENDDQLWLKDGQLSGYNNRQTVKMLERVGWNEWIHLATRAEVFDVGLDNEGDFVNNSQLVPEGRQLIHTPKLPSVESIGFKDGSLVCFNSSYNGRIGWHNKTNQNFIAKALSTMPEDDEIEQVKMYPTNQEAKNNGYCTNELKGTPKTNDVFKFIIITTRGEIWLDMPEVKETHVLFSPFVQELLTFIDIKPLEAPKYHPVREYLAKHVWKKKAYYDFLYVTQ